MSYRFNKDKRNSKNSSFNKRSSNYSRQDNDPSKSNYNESRRTNNKISRFSSDQTNQYSLDNQSIEKSKSNSPLTSRYIVSSRFEKTEANSSF